MAYKKKIIGVVLPVGDKRLPGNPEKCPVVPCPPGCPGLALCKAASGHNQPVDMKAIKMKIDERDNPVPDLTKSST